MLKRNRRISRTRVQKQGPTDLLNSQLLLFFEKYDIFLRLRAACCILRNSRTRVHILALSRGFTAATCVFNAVLKQTRTTTLLIECFSRRNA